MLEPEDLLGHIRLLLGRKGKLVGRHFIITAGGTQEPIDPVRYISNRSSGKQGYALAQAAVDAGANVTLISAPTNLQPPIGVNLVEATTAGEMLKAVLGVSANADALIMAAAVADFQPKKESSEKLKKRDGIPQIQLESTPDILGTLASKEYRHARPKVVVGFAAESRDLLENAAEKLKAKKLDLIAANNIAETDAGFGVDSNRVILLHANEKSETLPLLSKVEVSELIIARITDLLESI
jgi:phosphopantothenoylcysteine decarboxylase/phosphopantothenate--cysteine ligase